MAEDFRTHPILQSSRRYTVPPSELTDEELSAVVLFYGGSSAHAHMCGFTARGVGCAHRSASAAEEWRRRAIADGRLAIPIAQPSEDVT